MTHHTLNLAFARVAALVLIAIFGTAALAKPTEPPPAAGYRVCRYDPKIKGDACLSKIYKRHSDAQWFANQINRANPILTNIQQGYRVKSLYGPIVSVKSLRAEHRK